MVPNRLDLLRWADQEHAGCAETTAADPSGVPTVESDECRRRNDEHQQVASGHEVAASTEGNGGAEQDRNTREEGGLWQPRRAPQSLLVLEHAAEVADAEMDGSRKQKPDEIVRERIRRPLDPKASHHDQMHHHEEGHAVDHVKEPEPTCPKPRHEA